MRLSILGVLAATLVVALPSASGQDVPPSLPMATGRTREAALKAAREAQRRFEVDRIRLSPTGGEPGGGVVCDAYVGRMCYNNPAKAEWYPTAEDPRIVAARDGLLDTLAAAALVAPADPWILGQRVIYLGESGRWEEGASLARDARGVSEDESWCFALEGLALHALGRFVDAEISFRSALARMSPDRAAEWSSPEWLLDGVGRAWWKRVPAVERSVRGALVWSLADPLWLVPGNDALTEIWARRTMARAREDARNGYGMSWGGDLTELTVRYGWPVGWNREPDRPFRNDVVAIGRSNPEARPFFPPGAALLDPAASTRVSWIADERTARSAYGPAYAAAILPGAGEITVFPRGDRFVIVGAQLLPDDTTFHAQHDHPGRRTARPPWSGLPAETGIILLPLAGGPPLEARDAMARSGGLMVEAPAGDYVASLESFAPEQRRAGRVRLGIRMPALPPDLVTLSDLLPIDAALPDGATLEDAARHALPRAWVPSGARIAIAWELFGLGRRPESIAYRFSVERSDGSLVRAAGRMLGLVRPPSGQRLEWQEIGPDRPGPVLRTVEIELPDAPPGRYRVRLEVEVAGRTPIVKTRTVEIEKASR